MEWQNKSTIECTRCSSDINIYSTQCPNCGLVLYPDAYDDSSPSNVGSVDPVGGVSITSILLGWISAAILIFILNFILKGLLSGSPSREIVISIIGICGAILGGFVTGFISAKHSIFYGIVIGLLSIGTTLLFQMFWANLVVIELLRWDHIFTWILIIIGGILGIKLALLVKSDDSYYDFPEDEYLLYQDLLSRVQGDHGIVERLVAYERGIAPNSAREILLRNALDRWERDNRL